MFGDLFPFDQTVFLEFIVSLLTVLFGSWLFKG